MEAVVTGMPKHTNATQPVSSSFLRVPDILIDTHRTQTARFLPSMV